MPSYTVDTARKEFQKIINVEHPIIMAPMFLVSNVPMMKAALDSGITAAIPALNFRTIDELRKAIRAIKAHTNKPFGINLIVNKSNPKYKAQLEACLEEKIDYFITSLGSPQEVIEKSTPLGIKVICDVTNLEYAKKVESLGADAVIAVNSTAGGHCGPIPPEKLIPELAENISIPVISAGGISNHKKYAEALSYGAIGVSVGSIFIATEECDVSQDYKQAIVEHGKEDIVLTTRLSGSPLTVINTPYVQSMRKEATWLERLAKRNKKLGKYIKMFIFARGMKKVEQAANSPTYKTVWCAGPSIEDVKSIRPVREVVEHLINGRTQ